MKGNLKLQAVDLCLKLVRARKRAHSDDVDSELEITEVERDLLDMKARYSGALVDDVAA